MVNFFRGKRILVIGGTGSIGSEIVAQLLRLDPAVVRILSRDETRQFYFRARWEKESRLRFLVGDIRDERRLVRAMHGIDLVFHAAALKHVPSCEYNPFEAVQTNVVGTQNVISAALDAGVKRVLAISTDKAVNPANTMGATKLLSERLMAASSSWIKETRLSVVRFGNVLGSRGSLLPFLMKQVAEGGPVTLTHPEMTRFFMRKSQAVQLVLQAMTRMTGGEIFIFRMRVARISDFIQVLVEEAAPLFGRKARDLATRVTGIRPGEKLHEELFTDEEARRTRLSRDLLVIYPQPLRPTPPRRLLPLRYSADMKPMSREEIRKMFRDSGLLTPATVETLL